MKNKFGIGDKVEKAKGYEFPGTVVEAFQTTTGDVRYVVEMDRYRLLHIFNEEQLRLRDNQEGDEEGRV